MVLERIALILTVTLSCWALSSNGQGCSISFPYKNDKFQPLLLTNKTKWLYDFAIPNGKVLHIGSRESLTFLCASKGNTIESDYKNISSYPCSNGNTFIQRNKNVPFDSIHCTTIVKGSTVVTNTKCGRNQGRIINIGYQVTKSQFLTLIQSCYDSNAANPLYTNHTLHGEGMSGFSTQSYRPPFSEESIPYDLEANRLYSKITQKDTITASLKSDSLANQYYRKDFLSRGHLSPDADFFYAAMQFTTYFFVNINPQWQSVNAGNWLGIEKMVRKVAGKLKSPLQIYTGSHDVLELPDKNGKPAQIYLNQDGRIPVPKFLWKIVYNDKTKEGIALIAINNPFLSNVSNDDILCPDICDEYYWDTKSFKNPAKGYVYCCSVQDLRNAVPTVPYLNIRGILSA